MNIPKTYGYNYLIESNLQMGITQNSKGKEKVKGKKGIKKFFILYSHSM